MLGQWNTESSGNNVAISDALMCTVQQSATDFHPSNSQCSQGLIDTAQLAQTHRVEPYPLQTAIPTLQFTQPQTNSVKESLQLAPTTNSGPQNKKKR